MFVKKYFVHGLATGVLLSIVSALYSLENRLVTEIFPREKPSIHWPDKPHFEGLKQRTMQFFGIDADAGQIGILESLDVRSVPTLRHRTIGACLCRLAGSVGSVRTRIPA